MPPRKGRGGSRGRGRGIAKKRGPIPCQPMSPDTATADNTNAEGTSIDGNVSIKQVMSPYCRKGRGGSRGRGRGSKPRQPMSPDTATADNTNVEGTSIDGNASIKQVMSPYCRKGRGGSRGRGRGIAKRRGPKPRQPMSPDTATADNTNAEGTSIDGNVSIKQVMSPYCRKGRGGSRGRGRGPKPRQPMSPDTATADNTNAEGTSIDGNVSFKQVMSPPQSSYRKKHADYNEERELSLPRLKSIVIPENSTILSLLSRDINSEYIMTDDELDHVQWDLEAMLTNIILRRNTIRDELSTFASMQFAHSLHRMAKNSKLPTIRPRAAAEISPVNECRKMKVEFDPTSKELPPSKTESANKFWSLVEPYLSRVKKEDLKWLNDLVKSYCTSKNLYEIPPLGEHYAKNWAKEELEMQKNQSSYSPLPLKKLKFAERIVPDVVELVDKVNSAINDGNVYTPVYQRVVTALMDHSNMSLEDAEEHFSEFDDVEEKPQEMSNVCKEFYAEKNVKKQLHKLGLMACSSKQVPSPEEMLPSLTIADEENDEVLEEIVKCDNALAQLREMNKNHLTQLLGRCRKDYYQQIIKKKIEKVNNEILNFKTQQNESWTKGKKIAQMAEEADELHFLLNQRSSLLGQMHSVETESLYLSPLVSDDSESSHEDCELSNVHIKTEPTENDTDVKMDDLINDEEGCQAEERVEINITHEIVDNIMDFEEANDIAKNNDVKYDENVGNAEVFTEEIEIKKTVNKENETEKGDEANVDQEDQEDQIDVQTEINVNPLVKIKEEEVDCSEKLSIELRRKKPKKGISESEPTSKIEARKPIKIKQEPVDSVIKLKKFFFERRRMKPKKGISESELTSKIEARKPIKIKQEPVDSDIELEKLSIERRRMKPKKGVSESEPTSKIEARKPIKIKQEPVDSDIELEKLSIERRRKKPKKGISESEPTSKIEARKPIKIKQEPVDSDIELDPSENIIDDVKRELRPRKLNEPPVYFELYDGSTSEGSDFADLLD